MEGRIYPCNRPECKYTRETCHQAHSVVEWRVPEQLWCNFGDDCTKKNDTCFRLHNHSLEQKQRLATYKKIVFREGGIKRPSPPPLSREELLWKEKMNIMEEYEYYSNKMDEIHRKMQEFKEKASAIWVPGSVELEF